MPVGKGIKESTRFLPGTHSLPGEGEEVEDTPQPDCDDRSIVVHKTWPSHVGRVP